jgi:hypothetical protein
MTLGSTISSVMIRIKGDSSDAVKALDNVQDEAKKAEQALDDAAGGGDAMGKAMGVAAGAAAALAIAAAGVATAVQAYAETNESASDTLAGLSQRMNDMMTTVGEAIFESDGFREALGQAARVMQLVADNADDIASVISGSLNVAINTGIVVVDAYNTAVAGVRTAIVLGQAALDGMATAVVNMGSRLRMVGNTIIDFGLAIAQGVTGTMGDAIEMAADFIEGLQPIAEFAGIDLGNISEGLTGMADGLAENVVQLENLRKGFAESNEYQQALIDTNNEALGQRNAERVEQLVNIYDELDQQLQATGSSQGHAADELERYGRSVREVAPATAAAVTESNLWATATTGVANAMTLLNAQLDLIREKNDATAQAYKTQIGELEMLRSNLLTSQGAIGEFSTSMGTSLDQIEQQFSPMNQALSVFSSGAQDMLQQTAGAFVDAAFSGENVGKAFKQMMGDMLMAQGKASIMQGALAMIPFMPSFNPLGGAAYLAQGAIMFGAGKLMAGGKGGAGAGKGQGLSTAGTGQAPTTTPATQTMNSNVTVNNSFGIVGDQRQSARLVVDSLRYAQVEGL